MITFVTLWVLAGRCVCGASCVTFVCVLNAVLPQGFGLVAIVLSYNYKGYVRRFA